MLKIRNLLIISLIMLLPLSVFSIEETQNLNYLNFLNDKNSQTYKVSFEVKKDSSINNKQFLLEFYYNKEKNSKVCTQDISFNSNDLFLKVTCEIPKLGEGEYVLVAKTLDEEENTIETVKKTIYISKKNSVSINFIDQEDTTQIILDVQGDENENLIIENFIPKSVIEKLTNENKNNLIKTNYQYKILNEDPLIAWNVEKVPSKINYTINKKISQSQKEEFKIELKESSTFTILKFITYIMIFVIIISVFLNSKKKKR